MDERLKKQPDFSLEIDKEKNIFGVRIFLAAGEEKALVIDTGMTGVDIHRSAREVTDLPLMIINTHPMSSVVRIVEVMECISRRNL